MAGGCVARRARTCRLCQIGWSVYFERNSIFYNIFPRPITCFALVSTLFVASVRISQIQGHRSGCSSPHPTARSALHFCCEKNMYPLIDARQIAPGPARTTTQQQQQFVGSCCCTAINFENILELQRNTAVGDPVKFDCTR